MEVLVSGDTPKENIAIVAPGYSIESRLKPVCAYNKERRTGDGNRTWCLGSPDDRWRAWKVLAVMSDKYGLGDDELGSTLMTAFINVLDQIDLAGDNYLREFRGIFINGRFALIDRLCVFRASAWNSSARTCLQSTDSGQIGRR